MTSRASIPMRHSDGTATPPEPEGLDAVRAVADAVLYEGYLLYPYRRSSTKNRVRWQFGVLAPKVWTEARRTGPETVAGSADAWRQQTECLLEARPEATIDVRLRFLQLQHRSVQVRGPDGEFTEVDTVDTDGVRHLTFDEAVPHEFDVHVDLAELAEGRTRTVPIEVAGGEQVEPLGSEGTARIVRTRWPLFAKLHLSVASANAPFTVHRLRVVTENTVHDLAPEAPRSEALRRCLVATHTLLALHGGAFLSLLDPPAWAAAATRECVNLHTFPVLAGSPDTRNLVLSSPILMYDYPQVAPESPGDLFDATEIDELLSLRTLTLTDDEKREARATDPRAAEIIDRVDTIPRDVFARLHGAVRSLRPVSGDDSPVDGPRSAPPWWDPGTDNSTNAVVVDGVPVTRGSRVRLRPRTRGSDAHDMFLSGRTARVESVLIDVDGDPHIAVVLDDDPGADLHEWYGRYHYFAPEEVQPVGGDVPPVAGAVSDSPGNPRNARTEGLI